jgi:hypothetical protein
MKVGCPSIPSSLRLGLTLVIVLMVISSPVVMLVNPAIAAPPSAAAGDVTAYAPSTISQGGVTEDKEFTTQAALSLARSTQTSNIVDSKAYYDISFTTSTAGVIKFLTIVFPPGTNVGSAVLIEAEGIGTGTIAPAGSVATGQRLTYTVTNAVNVPALTKIRVEVADVNNPPVPSTSLTVTITTRNSAAGIIDGPTPTSAYNMKQIGTGQIADNAVTTSKIANGAITTTKPAESFMKRVTVLDDAAGNAVGWNPGAAAATEFTISEPAVSGQNTALISIELVTATNHFCDVTSHSGTAQSFTIDCSSAPGEGTTLHYIVENLPAHVVQ